ncbi:putative iron-sulfur cluster assembly accessory domain containing protein [Neospora caninum Liverpool]|uniref:Putative iron-sulfur cluster assembly accessory domain containing protein n=1 Tax=Neospora caninum (strain Liverpool) TaxID=572307 RepID=F0VAH6_NEOCL|nr:putative iron-sulfur cluster assembly accessory domain containing protein [Neospora caninum Liverpool]CBZ50665.1 putative iron-sulfur cluster assembly accessory domain containing protein [Neospora caninum Liverpool]|eukprot:XP_003880698.1 putative iron-sulfur cluster assembly accessory domain containing protein [Neospora caninum Liverpool]
MPLSAPRFFRSPRSLSASPLLCCGAPFSGSSPSGSFPSSRFSAFVASAAPSPQGRVHSCFAGFPPPSKPVRRGLACERDGVHLSTSACRFFAHDAGAFFSSKSPRKDALKAPVDEGQPGRLTLKEDGEAVIHISPAAAKRLTRIWEKRREAEAQAAAGASQSVSAAARSGVPESGKSSVVTPAAGRGAAQDGVPGERKGGSFRPNEETKLAFKGQGSPGQNRHGADGGERDIVGRGAHWSETDEPNGRSGETQGSTRGSEVPPPLGASRSCYQWRVFRIPVLLRFDRTQRARRLSTSRHASVSLVFFRMASPYGGPDIGAEERPRSFQGGDCQNEMRENAWCVVVDKCSVPLLENSVVDYSDTLAASEFRIVNNEQAENVCSCGHSFAIKDDF